MRYIVYSIIIGVVVVGGWELGKYIYQRVRMPYRWRCPKCNFTLNTNNRLTFDISKSSHNHARLAEFKDTDPWRSSETKAACKRLHPGEPCQPGRNHPAAGRV